MDNLMRFHEDSQPIYTKKTTRNKVIDSERQKQLLVEAEESGHIVYPFILSSSEKESKKTLPVMEKPIKKEKLIPTNSTQDNQPQILQLLSDQ